MNRILLLTYARPIVPAECVLAAVNSVSAAFLGRDGVVSVTDAVKDGRACVLVLVNGPLDNVLARLPQNVAGVPVFALQNGALRPLADAPTFASAGDPAASGKPPWADSTDNHPVNPFALARLMTGKVVQTRAELVLAALLCGQGTDHAGAGITTVLGHAIGARFATENGITNAIVLPHCIRFNAEAGREGLQKVAIALGLAAGHETALVEVVNNAAAALFDKLGVPSRLQDLGVPQEALTEIAATAMGDWFLRGNPRPVRDVAQLQQILEQAW